MDDKTIKFTCSHCGVKIRADLDMAGDFTECPQCSHRILIPMPGIHPGLMVGNFRIERRLGRGGMGEVWLAHQMALDRPVALKILSPALTRDSQFLDRFQMEVRTAGQLQHPNIVAAFDAGEADGIHFLATSFVDGEALEQTLERRGHLGEREALAIVRCVAEALRYAWNRFKLMHRDIKPGNIMVDAEGEVRLMDMGISKCLERDDPRLTTDGHFVGTPYYMSPEQARGDADIDFRTDVYALGATLYHLLTGEVPYTAETMVGILAKHITEPLQLPGKRRPGLSTGCDALVEIMMAKKPDERQRSWEDVIRDVDAVLSGGLPETRCPRGSPHAVLQASHASRRVIRVHTAETQLADTLPRRPARSSDDGDTHKRTHLLVAAAALLALVAAGSWMALAMRNQRGEGQGNGPVSPPVAPANPPAEDDGKRHRQAWAQVREAARAAMAGEQTFEAALERIEDVRPSLAGSGYEAELKRLGNRLKIARRERVQRATGALRRRVQALESEGRYEEAMALLRNYDGPREDDTNAALLRSLEQLHQHLDRRRNVERHREEQERKRRYDFLLEISDRLVSGRYEEAADAYATHELNGEFPELEEPLMQLGDLEGFILDSFREQAGWEVRLQLRDGWKEVRIDKVDNNGIQASQEVPGGWMGRRFTAADLHEEERARRLASLHPVARAILTGVREARRHPEKTAEVFGDAGTLAEPLRETVRVRHRATLNDAAERGWSAVWQSAGVNEAPGLDQDPDRLDLQPGAWDGERVSRLQWTLSAYRDRFDDSAFVVPRMALLDRLQREVDQAGAALVQDVFRGRVTAFNETRGSIEVIYDFADERQLEDWYRVRRLGLHSSGYARVEEDHLLLDTQGRGQILLAAGPRFSELEAEVRGEYTRGHFDLALLAQDHVALAEIAGGADQRDGYRLAPLDGDRAEIRARRGGRPTATRPRAPFTAVLAWRESSMRLQVDGRPLPEQEFESGSVRFGLSTFASSIRVDKVTVRGTLEKDWLEQARKERR